MRADGGWVWLDGRSWFERDSQGVVVRIQGLLLDISARKEAELALSEHAGRLQLAVAATGLGTFDHDVRTGILVTSPEYALMLGYDPVTFRESPQRWASGVHPLGACRSNAVAYG